MAINFDTGTLYARVGNNQVGGAAGLSDAFNESSQAANDTVNEEIDNRNSARDPVTGQIVYFGGGMAPQTSLGGLFGNACYNLVHGGSREEVGFVASDDGIPVVDEHQVSTVDDETVPPNLPAVPTTGGTA